MKIPKEWNVGASCPTGRVWTFPTLLETWLPTLRSGQARSWAETLLTFALWACVSHKKLQLQLHAQMYPVDPTFGCKEKNSMEGVPRELAQAATAGGRAGRTFFVGGSQASGGDALRAGKENCQ